MRQRAFAPAFSATRVRAGFSALWLALALGACAPLVQQAARPPAAFAGPHLEQDAFISFDGARLGLTRWMPQDEPWAAIVAVHGMNSYARAFHQAGPRWASDGVAVYAYDQRGFGRSPDRGVWPGERLLTEDLRTMVALVRARHPHAIIAVAATSMGGSTAIEAFASDRPPDADRLMLLAPAIDGWSSATLLSDAGVWLLGHTIRGVRVTPPNWLLQALKASDNADELASARHDPLMTWRMRPDSFNGLYTLADRASRDLPKVRAPVLYLYGAKDRIEPKAPTFRTVRGLKPTDRSGYYADGWHLLLLDRQAPRVFADVEAFVRDPTQPLPSGAPPIPSRVEPR
jgi:alpha-beta hydrolase superfamily lysophospholipase